MDRSQKIIENVLKLHHAEEDCCSIRSVGLGVLEFEDKEALLQALLKQGKRCVEDGAECILLGCAGYTAFAEEMRQELGGTRPRRRGACRKTLRKSCRYGIEDAEEKTLGISGCEGNIRIL